MGESLSHARLSLSEVKPSPCSKVPKVDSGTGRAPTPASEPPSPTCTTPLEEEGGQEGFGQSQPHSVASAHLHSCPWSHCRPPAPRASCQTRQATAVLYSGLKKKKGEKLVVSYNIYVFFSTAQLEVFRNLYIQAIHKVICISKRF